MGDIGDFWNDVKAARKAAGLPARGGGRRRAEPPTKRDEQRFADLGFVKKSEWHWQMQLSGDLLNFWPSKCKWQWRGEVKTANWNELFRLIQSNTQPTPE